MRAGDASCTRSLLDRDDLYRLALELRPVTGNTANLFGADGKEWRAGGSRFGRWRLEVAAWGRKSRVPPRSVSVPVSKPIGLAPVPPQPRALLAGGPEDRLQFCRSISAPRNRGAPDHCSRR